MYQSRRRGVDSACEAAQPSALPAAFSESKGRSQEWRHVCRMSGDNPLDDAAPGCPWFRCVSRSRALPGELISLASIAAMPMRCARNTASFLTAMACNSARTSRMKSIAQPSPQKFCYASMLPRIWHSSIWWKGDLYARPSAQIGSACVPRENDLAIKDGVNPQESLGKFQVRGRRVGTYLKVQCLLGHASLRVASQRN